LGGKLLRGKCFFRQVQPLWAALTFDLTGLHRPYACAFGMLKWLFAVYWTVWFASVHRHCCCAGSSPMSAFYCIAVMLAECVILRVYKACV